MIRTSYLTPPPLQVPLVCRNCGKGNRVFGSEPIQRFFARLHYVNSGAACQANRTISLKRMLHPDPELHGGVAVDGFGDIEAEHGAFDEAEPGDVDAEAQANVEPAQIPKTVEFFNCRRPFSA